MPDTTIMAIGGHASSAMLERHSHISMVGERKGGRGFGRIGQFVKFKRAPHKIPHSGSSKLKNGRENARILLIHLVGPV